VWVAARQLRSQGLTVEVQALSMPTGVISRSFQDLGARYGREILGNLLQSLVPFVKRDATVVTVFTGANDANTIVAALGGGAGGSNPTAYIDQMVSTFGTDFAALVAGIRERAPGARIIALNLPNLAAMPYLASASLAQKQAAQRASVRMSTTVINAQPGIAVVDVLCDPRLYQPASLSADGYHPSDAGYAVLGAEIAAAVQAASYPAPRATCAQMALF
jgi:lysophospholipase L1-like esterase